MRLPAKAWAMTVAVTICAVHVYADDYTFSEIMQATEMNKNYYESLRPAYHEAQQSNSEELLDTTAREAARILDGGVSLLGQSEFEETPASRYEWERLEKALDLLVLRRHEKARPLVTRIIQDQDLAFEVRQSAIRKLDVMARSGGAEFAKMSASIRLVRSDCFY